MFEPSSWHSECGCTLTRWYLLCQQFNIDAQPAIEEEFKRISTAYNEAHRAYHTSQHLNECLAWLDWGMEQAPIGLSERATLEIALWYHDVVYQPQSSNNERCSADQAIAFLQAHQVEPAQITEVEVLILATRHGAKTRWGGTATKLAAWMVDIDLAILAASPQRFWQYNEQIRQEYVWVPKTVYCTQRGKLLAQFLKRSPLYRSRLFRERLEPQARQNLSAALCTPIFSLP